MKKEEIIINKIEVKQKLITIAIGTGLTLLFLGCIAITLILTHM